MAFWLKFLLGFIAGLQLQNIKHLSIASAKNLVKNSP